MNNEARQQSYAEEAYDAEFDRLEDQGQLSSSEIRARLGPAPYEIAEVALRSTIDSRPISLEARRTTDSVEKQALLLKYNGNEIQARAAYIAIHASNNSERAQQGLPPKQYTAWEELDQNAS